MWFLWTLNNDPSSSLNIHFHSPFLISFFVSLFFFSFFWLWIFFFLDFLYFMCVWEDGVWFLWTLKNDSSSSLTLLYNFIYSCLSFFLLLALKHFFFSWFLVLPMRVGRWNVVLVDIRKMIQVVHWTFVFILFYWLLYLFICFFFFSLALKHFFFFFSCIHF